MKKESLRRRDKKERRGRARGEKKKERKKKKKKKKKKENRFHLKDPDYRTDSIPLRYFIFFKKYLIK